MGQRQRMRKTDQRAVGDAPGPQPWIRGLYWRVFPSLSSVPFEKWGVRGAGGRELWKEAVYLAGVPWAPGSGDRWESNGDGMGEG